MTSCDVLIVGGGPAGSSCAWGLRQSDLDVMVLDKQVFPRDKVCGGWITPEVLGELDIDLCEYGLGRMLQPIQSFAVGSINGTAVEVAYRGAVSYGICRREFDDYLLRRSGARLVLGTALNKLTRSGEEWIVNDEIRARLIVGAGGHFCPVARFLGARIGTEPAVVAQEVEFEMSPEQAGRCRIRPETPELYFCADLKGYGWCFRKGNKLNIGLGRADSHRLSSHVAGFVEFLKSSKRLTFDVPPMHGHAYLLHGASTRSVAAGGVLLLGDSAGLAFPLSGEGIRPAVESGLLAAKTIIAAAGHYSAQHLESYRDQIAPRPKPLGLKIGAALPAGWLEAVGRRLLSTRWFVRNIVLEDWFLRAKPARA